MNVVAVLALAGLLAGQASRSPAALPGGTGDVSADADTVTRDPDGRVHLEGNVVVRRGLVTLRARSARVDPATGEIDAVGDVLLTDATRAIAADGVHALLGGPFEAEHVTAFVKEGAVDLGSATSLEQARRNGRNRLSFSGARLEGERSGRLALTDARLSLCDCGGGAPSWEFRARSADVIPGKRAILSWPVLYVTPRFLFIQRPVPVLIVPWLMMPLSDRQTGLLIPMIESTSTTGFTISQPVFVTLGRSADATVTPEYSFGPGTFFAPASKGSEVRGPGARLELRWAPAVDADGRVELAWVHDFAREAGGGSGDRLSITGAHQQRLGPDTHLRLDLALASDPVLWRDYTPDVLLRSAFYRRSDVLLSHRSDAVVLEGAAAYLLPLTPAAWVAPQIAGPGAPRPAYGVFGSDIPVLHPWPSFAATLVPAALGPIELSGRAGVARFATASGDAQGGPGPGDPGAAVRTLSVGGEPVNYAGVGARDAATRLDAHLEVSAPVLVAGAVTVAPYVRGAALGYAFDAGRDPTAVEWAAAGAAVSTELARRYGKVEHRILPRFELRAGTAAAGGGASLALPAYDVWDRFVQPGPQTLNLAAGPTVVNSSYRLQAAPQDAFSQARLSVDNRLRFGGVDRLRLEVGQDLDVRAGRFAETFFSAGVLAGPVTGDISGRFLAIQGRPETSPTPKYTSWLDAFTELRAGISVGNPRGDVLRAGLLAVGAGGSGPLMAGVDPLFDLRTAPIDAIASGTFGARVVLGAGTVGYDALLPARAQDVQQCSGGGATRRVAPWQIQQHTGSFVWDSPCHCFLARLAVTVNDCGGLHYAASLDLSRLAEGVQFR
ncbi:LPS-assembly protein LptD [Anaeromyxobacter oryzae]|uniref:LPS-assembly protein LptD n=1 Tax=Anaeromyxobacter oryzae TaxID=2918170 RepID=A0ABM7X2Z2_9BACT|nr:LPS-assembly protein LptD [Anaeromyxobacter oryzae]BDG06168.1 hypothetical protein AMOR_51640 [Anaeromyxobacter oryzae]